VDNNQKIANELLKIYADSFLARNNIMDSDTDLKNKGVIQEKGVLYGNQIFTLQNIIQEELKILGLDLVEVLKSKGIEFKTGELSDIEHKLINFKVNNIMSFVDKYEEKKRNHNQAQ